MYFFVPCLLRDSENEEYVQIRYELEILLPCRGRKDTDEKQAQRKTKHHFELLHRNALNVLRLTS